MTISTLKRGKHWTQFCLRLSRRARKELKWNLRDANYLAWRLLKQRLPQLQRLLASCESDYIWMQRMGCKEGRKRSTEAICKLVLTTRQAPPLSSRLPLWLVSYRGQAFSSVQKSARHLGCPGLVGSRKNCLSPLLSSAALWGAKGSSWEAHHSSSG